MMGPFLLLVVMYSALNLYLVKFLLLLSSEFRIRTVECQKVSFPKNDGILEVPFLHGAI